MTALQHARSTALLVALLLVCSGCPFPTARQKTSAIPVPDPPHPVAAKSTPPPKPPVEVGPPPSINAKAPEVNPQLASVITEQKVPPKPKPPKKKVAARKPTPPPNVAPAEIAPPTDSVPLPKLGELISEDRRASELRGCDSALANARQALGQLKGVQLTTEQTDTVERIRTFISQAQDLRETDPQTARQLADRADLLSRSLVRNIK